MIGLLALLRVSQDFPPLPGACLPDQWQNEQSDQQLTKQPETCCTALADPFLLWLV